MQTIAPRAGEVVRAGGDLLAFDGRHRYTLLKGEPVGDVQIFRRRAYARTARGLRVIDLRRGRVIARGGRARRDVVLLAPR